MPRIVDTGYHNYLSQPNYYSKEQQDEYLEKRIEDTILENRIPPIPTRQMELDYLDKLEKDFRSDSWFSVRWRKLQAGPLRAPYKRTRELVNEFRFAYAQHFALGVIFALPFAVYVGRRLRKTSGGIPKVYMPKNYHQFPNVNPDYSSRWKFRKGFYTTIIASGFFFGSWLTPRPFQDEYYSRPDFKPDTPMVEDTEEIKKAKEELYSSIYAKEWNQKRQAHFKNGPIYRLFRPNQAEYKIRYENRQGKNDPYNSWDVKKGTFPSDSRMHEQHW